MIKNYLSRIRKTTALIHKINNTSAGRFVRNVYKSECVRQVRRLSRTEKKVSHE